VKIKFFGWFSGVSKVLLYFLMEDEGSKRVILHKLEILLSRGLIVSKERRITAYLFTVLSNHKKAILTHVLKFRRKR
jgi:hypothetical protein